jgi:hypothetical protein
VLGLAGALSGGDLHGAADWIAPDQRSAFTDAIDEAKSLGLQLSFHVKDFAVVSVHMDNAGGASVKYSGEATACITRPGTPSTGNGCQEITSQSGVQAADTLDCVRQGGKWYVSINSALQGSAPAARTGLATV